jgi:alpha-amylase/alpha-mannosidase (GH57 family)
VSASPPLRVVFLWHFHQPWYREIGGAPARLPWVRLHALKDYADLPALLAEEPRVPHACNLVPGLLDQIELAAAGASDTFLEVARVPVAEWDGAAVAFALGNFFAAHPKRIEAFPRYAELKRRAHELSVSRASGLRRWFSPDDLRDLVVLFHLAWSGPQLLADPLLVRLRKRGHGFSEDDRAALLERQTAFLGEVVPAWKRAFASGVVEAATSPYHHPILPLLVDGTSAREALPGLSLPPVPFRRPEDARSQIALGLSTFERHFGFRPRGMWPPEGSLSEPVLSLLAEAGMAWTATDEEVLLHSLTPAQRDFGEGDRARTVFRPYRLSHGASPAIFFRDRVLSDRIGFSYASWPAEDAAADFVARLESIRQAAPTDELVVPVILDGENAWETYPDNGVPFLRALSRALVAAPGVKVITPSAALSATEPAPLPRLVAGSWVNGNFATWIGAPPKNRAWELLTTARETLAPEIASARDVPPTAFLTPGSSGPEAAKAALLAAEASDWFWWFGDDHSSEQDAVFDALFRSHVAAAYRALGRTVPIELERPIEARKIGANVIPTSPIAPHLDGAPPDYFEWLGAGHSVPQATGTMSRGAALVKEVFFGASADGARLFFRIDAAAPPASRALAGHRLRVEVVMDGRAPDVHELPIVDGLREANGCSTAAGRILELALPRPDRPLDEPLSFRIVLIDAAGHEAEAIPPEGFLHFRTLTGDWSA